MNSNLFQLVFPSLIAIVATSCAYHGGERQSHKLNRPDGTSITCFEPPAEVVQKVFVATAASAAMRELEGSLRAKVSPERIREKLPSDAVVFELVDFRTCVNYANGIYTAQEYKAFLAAKTLFQNERISIETGSPTPEGDSFCYLGFLFAVGGEDRPSLVAYRDGKYPLQNVQIKMIDVELLHATLPDIPKGASNARPMTVEEVEKFDKIQVQFFIPAFGSSGTVQQLQRSWQLPRRDQVTYSIQIHTPYQTFYQHMKLRKVNGMWSEAYRVIKHSLNKEIVVLHEKVPSNFPRDQSGRVNWLYY